MTDSLDRTGPSQLSRRTVTGLLVAAAATAGVRTSIAAAPDVSRVSALGRGFNLPDWVNLDHRLAPSDEVLAELRSLGFGAVRLPVDGDQFGLGDSATRLAASKLLEDALRRLTAHGYAVTVDLHSLSVLGELFDAEPGEAETAVAAAWDELGRVVAGFAPDRVFAELLNEPPMERARWLPLRDRLAEVVRKLCPDHTLIWGAARYQGIWETLDTPVLAVPNSIAAVHYYAPLGFTHQCESWSGSPFARFEALPFPAERHSPGVIALRDKLTAAGDTEALDALDEEFEAPWSVAHIAKDFADIGKWSLLHECPVILNEFGVYNACVDPLSRAAWTRAVREAAEQNGIGWNYWELDQGFGFIESRQSLGGFDHPLINALLAG